MSTRRIVLISIGLLFVVGVFLAMALGLFLVSPAQKGAPAQVVIVREGQSPRELADDLEQKGIVSSSRLFLFWTRLLGYGKMIRAGEYSLSPDMSPMTILEKLIRGLVITYPITIPEGFTRLQIAELLAQRGLVDKETFLSLTRDPAVLKKYAVSGPNLEGYLFPDTYHFARGTLAQTVVDTMVKRFFQMVLPSKEAVEKSGMKMEEVITLASIVEKETGRAEERPLIASVFLNRLKKGMRLDSDPTVIYGIENFDGDLKKHDLTRETPYNTYVIPGLTPGPIANPGLASIRAVLFPAKTRYLYFVAKNDGSHHFSRTLAEHNRAVNTYQRKKAQPGKKAP
ncbi:MAG: endolytic transglycosylase MltG [Thermodesulfobacteriota bacterium]